MSRRVGPIASPGMGAVDFSRLAMFVEVARHASLTRASVVLGVTPTALSKSLMKLETELGLRLFNRTTRAMRLTEEGSELLRRISAPLLEIGRAVSEVSSADDDVRGELRITAPTAAYSMLIEPHQSEFLAQYPSLKVEVSINDAWVDSVAEGYDCGIRLGAHLARDVQVVPLVETERMILVASPGYLERRDPPTQVDDLALHDCIGLRLKSSHQVYPWSLRGNGELRNVTPAYRLNLDSMNAVLGASVRGCGIAYVFERQAEAALNDGRLVRVLPGHWFELPGWYAYYSSHRQVSARLRAFVDFYRTAIARMAEVSSSGAPRSAPVGAAGASHAPAVLV